MRGCWWNGMKKDEPDRHHRARTKIVTKHFVDSLTAGAPAACVGETRSRLWM